MSTRIRVGVSSCLLGQEVRFDGGHKRNAWIDDTLSAWFEFVPVCPEVAIGLGTPREPIRLVQRDGEVRAVGVRHPDRDVTQPLRDYGERMAGELAGISGYIFKRGSPSCGLERVKVYGEKGMPVASGAGIYTETFRRKKPLLPVEDEGRLNDPRLRESFIARVFVYHRWQQLQTEGFTPARLVAFHAAHKFLILAHDEIRYRELGRLVADAGRRPAAELQADYIALLMQALGRPTTRRRHVNVLQHLAGWLKRDLDTADRAELAASIEDYRLERVPLVVPLTLLRHHFRHHPDPYMAGQIYLEPYPVELGLRNAI